MPFLSRKFSRSKWEGCDPYKPDEIPADAITSDLRTSANTLSFWICTDEEVARRDLRTTVLAMAANYERLDKIDVCWISEAEAEDAGLILNPSSGATPVESLRSLHVDVVQLDLGQIRKLACLITAALAANRFLQVTRKGVLGIIVAAVRNKQVQLDALQDKLRQEVQKELSKAISE